MRVCWRDVIYWGTCWVVLWGFYLLLASKLAWDESAAGIVAAAIAATALAVTRAKSRMRQRPRLGWIGQSVSLPRKLLVESVIVIAALWQRLVRGERIEGHFATLTTQQNGDDPVSAAQRAWEVTKGSLAPNNFVVTIDGLRGQTLIHELVASDRASNRHGREEST